MGCINADGSLTRSGLEILRAVEGEATPEEVARRTYEPLYRVRSALRQLGEAGLVEARGDLYAITGEGLRRVGA